MSSRQILGLLIIILLLAGGIRVARILVKSRLTTDEVTYIYNAEDILKGARDSFKYGDGKYRYNPPFLIFGMAGLMKLGLSGELAGQAIAVFFGVLMTLGCFFLGQTLWGKTELGLLTAFLAAVQPYLCRIGANIWRDGPYIAFMVWSLYFAVRGARSFELKYWVMFAISATLGITTRKEGFEIYLGFVIWIAVEVVLRYREIKNIDIRLVKIFVLVTVLVFGSSLAVYQLCLRHNYHWRPFQKYKQQLLDAR